MKKKKDKILNLIMACGDCMVECKPTKDGILCPKCDAYISDEALNFFED